MQIKTTVRYYQPCNRMAKIKNNDGTKCWRGAEEGGHAYRCCPGKLSGSFLTKNWTQYCHMTQKLQLWTFILGEMRMYVLTKTYIGAKVRPWKQPCWPSDTSGGAEPHTRAREHHSALKKNNCFAPSWGLVGPKPLSVRGRPVERPRRLSGSWGRTSRGARRLVGVPVNTCCWRGSESPHRQREIAVSRGVGPEAALQGAGAVGHPEVQTPGLRRHRSDPVTLEGAALGLLFPSQCHPSRPVCSHSSYLGADTFPSSPQNVCVSWKTHPPVTSCFPRTFALFVLSGVQGRATCEAKQQELNHQRNHRLILWLRLVGKCQLVN